MESTIIWNRSRDNNSNQRYSKPDVIEGHHHGPDVKAWLIIVYMERKSSLQPSISSTSIFFLHISLLHIYFWGLFPRHDFHHGFLLAFQGDSSFFSCREFGF
jgi:hypothetical protein